MTMSLPLAGGDSPHPSLRSLGIRSPSIPQVLTKLFLNGCYVPGAGLPRAGKCLNPGDLGASAITGDLATASAAAAAARAAGPSAGEGGRLSVTEGPLRAPKTLGVPPVAAQYLVLGALPPSRHE